MCAVSHWEKSAETPLNPGKNALEAVPFRAGFFVALPHTCLYNAHAIHRPAWKNHTTCATNRRPEPMGVAFLVPEA